MRRGARKKPISMRAVRSSITNGTTLFNRGVTDGRTRWCRRFADLIDLYTLDIGSSESLTEGQRCLIKSACSIQICLEMMAETFARNEGQASAGELDAYCKASGQLRRILSELGVTKGRPAPLTIELGGKDIKRYLEAGE